MMLTRVSRTLRWRAAVTLALAYMLCVVLPPVAHAFIGSATTAQLAAVDRQHDTAMADVATAHIHVAATTNHVGDTTHRHHNGDDTSRNGADGHDKAVGCCGYFCMSAAPFTLVQDIPPALGVLVAAALANRGIIGRGPARIDRPPIVLLPL